MMYAVTGLILGACVVVVTSATLAHGLNQSLIITTTPMLVVAGIGFGAITVATLIPTAQLLRSHPRPDAGNQDIRPGVWLA